MPRLLEGPPIEKAHRLQDHSKQSHSLSWHKRAFIKRGTLIQPDSRVTNSLDHNGDASKHFLSFNVFDGR